MTDAGQAEEANCADTASGAGGAADATDPIRAAQLMERLRSGDAQAMEEIVAEHGDRIGRLVYRLDGWSGDAEDLVQEVFVSAMTHARSFEGRADLATWLYRIAINVCRSHRRKQSMRRWLWKRWAGGREALTSPHSGEAMETHERAERLRESVRRLPGKYREVVVLRYLEEMNIDNVAATLNLSRSAVEVRLHRARERLREMLGEEELV